MRNELAGEARLAEVECARETLQEAVGLELLASNLRRGATSSSGAWASRRFGSRVG